MALILEEKAGVVIGRGIILIIWLGLCSLAASASTVHKLRFSHPAKVLVWQSGEMLGQGAEVSVFADRSTAPPEWLGSGTLLVATHETSSEPQTMTLSIASNSGFVIKLDDPLRAPDITVRIVGVGMNAGAAEANADLSAGVMYRQHTKTAQKPGRPETQALLFEVTWSGETPPRFDVIALAP